MSDTPPFSLTQNPAPNPLGGQDFQAQRRALVDQIMGAFRNLLPSNYVASTNGPWYSLQFQAMAEQLADIQISTGEIYKDSDWDFTRTDFLWQVLGEHVFPGATDKSGIPQISKDTDYRAFLQEMVLKLLQGSTKASLEGGVRALDSDLVVSVVERYLESPPRDPNGGYTIADQFTIDVFVEGFSADPFVTQANVALVLAALKPAHVLYSYSHLFRDAFGEIATDGGGPVSWDIEPYHYADMRKWCLGAKQISGAAGVTLSNRTYFSDPSVSFSQVSEGAVLRVLSGANAGVYRVVGTRALVGGASTTAASYTLSGGGSGSLTATAGDIVEDTSRDWGLLGPDELLTITSGVNAATYRLEAVLGSSGGPVGQAGVSGTRVRLAPTIIKTARRMPQTATGQTYEVSVDRLGVKLPKTVSGEDVSEQFLL